MLRYVCNSSVGFGAPQNLNFDTQDVDNWNDRKKLPQNVLNYPLITPN